MPKKIDSVEEYFSNISDQEPIEYEENSLEELNKKVTDLINFANYLGDNLSKSVTYTDYLSEHLDKSVGYINYISKHDGIPSMEEYEEFREMKLNKEETERYFKVKNREKRLNKIIGDEQSESE